MATSVQIKSMKPKHEAIIDWLLAHPGRAMRHLAAEMGISQSWLSIVMHSDVFKEAYEERRSAHNQELSKQIIQKQLKVTLKALGKVEQFLGDDDEVDLKSALDVATQTSKVMGFHPSPGIGPTVVEERTREVRTVEPGVLREARETIKRHTYGSDSTD